jgi:DNA-binding transcriptional regulator YbjK
MPKAVDHDERREQIAHAACIVVARNGFEAKSR